MAEEIAGKRCVGVARVFHPGKPLRTGIGFQFGAGQLQQRPDQAALPQRPTLRHRRQSAHTGAAQQAEQQGLGLVVAVLGAEQDLVGA
ncbi:hypothetical protein FQZ97_820350 [compost metagenome]